MQKLLSGLALLTTLTLGVVSAPGVVSAAGTAAMEQTILSSGLVPETEVSRITSDTSLCSSSGSETSADVDILCEETYPGSTRVTITGSGAGRVVTIRDKDNKVVTQSTATTASGTEVTRDADGEKVSEQQYGEGGGCSFGNLAACIVALPGFIASGIAYLLLQLSIMFLYVTGTVFNWVVLRTVFQFGLYFGTSEGMLIAWGVLRDIGNIALLFGFIFMGIATILNTHNVEGYTARKALPQLIIFAVLLNFSLFASQAVIDVANGFSSVFATYAGQNCDTTTTSATSNGQTQEACAQNGISGQVLSAVGITSIFSSQPFSLAKPYEYAVTLIMLSLLISLTAVVLLAAAIMLIVRVVSLSLLMVTSPIGFAGMAIPALHGLARDWWHRLINQAFFAPIYLLMVFLSLKMAESLKGSNVSLSDAIIGNALAGQTTAGNMQVVMVFLIIIGFMIASLVVAQKMGAYGASFATNSAASFVYGNMTRISNLGAGAVGVGMRSMAARQARDARAQGREPSLATAALMRTGTQLKGANLDPRRFAPVSAALKAGGGSGAVSSHSTFNDMQHEFDDAKSGKALKEYRETANKELLLKELDAVHGDTLDNPALKQKLASMSVKDLEKVHGIKDGVRGLIDNISAEQFEGLMKGGLSDFDKGKIAQARFANLTSAVQKYSDAEKESDPKVKEAAQTAASDIVKNAIKNMTKGELESLPGSALAEGSIVLTQLTDKQREDLAGSNKRTVEERSRIKDSGKIPAFEKALKEAIANKGTDPDGAYRIATDSKTGIRSFNPTQVAKLGADTLKSEAVAVELTPAMLMELQESKKLSADDIQTIANHIRGTTASSGHAYVTSGAGAAYWS